MKLYLARHGRTNYNDLSLCNGDPSVDVHLTSEGIEQAKNLAKSLEMVTFDCIYVSEMKRTQQTAEIINMLHDAPVRIDRHLNDIRTGYEGKPAHEYYEALNQADSRWTAQFNGGESVENVRERIGNFLNDLRMAEYGAVLVVTSEMIVQLACGILQNLTNEEAFSIEVNQATYREIAL